jgi:hypothetical protein
MMKRGCDTGVALKSNSNIFLQGAIGTFPSEGLALHSEDRQSHPGNFTSSSQASAANVTGFRVPLSGH